MACAIRARSGRVVDIAVDQTTALRKIVGNLQRIVILLKPFMAMDVVRIDNRCRVPELPVIHRARWNGFGSQWLGVFGLSARKRTTWVINGLQVACSSAYIGW